MMSSDVIVGLHWIWKPWAVDKGVIVGLRAGFVLTLWFYAFAVNTFVWRNRGINNILIFEFNPRDNLSFQRLFEVN